MAEPIPGKLHVANDVLADMVGHAALECYGVVGMVPSSEAWAKLIEECKPAADKVTRYAIKKGAKFDRANLQKLVDALPEGYEIKRIDGEL